jgi:hypothetical protein
MLKKLVVVPILIFSLGLSAQQKHVLNYPLIDYRILHFGFTIGMNSFDFNFDRSSTSQRSDPYFIDVSTIEPGFNVSIVSELRLNEDFALRFLPGLAFGQRNLNFIDNQTNKSLGRISVESNYIDLPLLIKYKAKRLNNFRPYLIAGTTARYDMAAKKSNNNPDLPVGYKVSLYPLDFYADLGFGVDFYLTYFKLSTEIKLSLGMRDVLETNMSDSGLNGLSSKIVMINFHFE